MAHSRALPLWRGLTYVVIAAVAWGTGGAVAVVLYKTTELGPMAVSFWRFALGVVVLAPALMLTRPRVAVRARRGVLIGTGLGLAISQAAYFAAVAESGVAIATVLTLGVSPVVVALGAQVMLGERIGGAGAITVVAALIGLVLLAAEGSTAEAKAGGIALALMSGVGLVCLLPMALTEGLLPGVESAGDVTTTAALLVYLGAAPTAAAYALFFAGLEVVRATTASIIVLIEPITAAVIGVGLLGERMSAPEAAGAVIMLGAVVGLAWRESRTAPS